MNNINFVNNVNNVNDGILHEYSEYINHINDVAYKDIYMLSNPSLSKNPYSGSTLLENLLQHKKRTKKYGKTLFVRSATTFYVKNLFYLLIWLIHFGYAKFFIKIPVKKINHQVVLVDTFFGKSQTNESMEFEDPFFKGLYSILDQYDIDYVLLPNIFGVNSSIVDGVSILRYLSKIKCNVVTEYDVLDSSDIFKIIQFIFKYPYRASQLTRLVKNEKNIDNLFLYDLNATIAKTSFHAYVKYLFGKKLKFKYRDSQIKLISWCENQTIDKNFYKGIRSKNTHIYGCQFFIKYPICQSHYISDNEKIFGITPDTTLVTGKYYVPEKSCHVYKIGPAFRYRDIYNHVVTKHIDNDGAILVMLSYIEKDAFDMIDLLKNVPQLDHYTVHLKIHPNHRQSMYKYEKYINIQKWKMVDHIDNFKGYSVVITSGSGSAMEFAAMGLSVIILATTTLIANPMPDYGKGIIWELTDSSSGIWDAYGRLVKQRDVNKGELYKLSKSYKENFFSSVDDEIAIRNFDLDEFVK